MKTLNSTNAYAADLPGQRPGVQPVEDSRDFREIEVQLDAAELTELADLPHDDRGYAPDVSLEELSLGRLQALRERVPWPLAPAP